MSAKTKRVLKWVSLIAGIGVVAYLVYETGPARVLETLIAAGPFMLLLVLFDAGWFGLEVLSHRILLEEDAKKIPWPAYLRTQLITYVFMVLVPTGRAGAEVARATALNKYIGAGRAAAAATNAQATSFIANTLISIPCLLAVVAAVGWEHPLAWLVGVNGVVTLVAGSAILVVARKLRVGGFLAKRIKKLVNIGDALDSALRVPRRRLAGTICVNVLARLSQTMQYGLAVLAVGGVFSVGNSFLAEGIHLVGAFAGDFVPNQVGIAEATYRLFAGALGFAADPAKAVSVVLLARVSQVVLATTSLSCLVIAGGAAEVSAAARIVRRGGDAETAEEPAT